MNTTPKFSTNFWVKDENEANDENHQKERFTKLYQVTSGTSFISRKPKFSAISNSDSEYAVVPF